MLGLCEADGFEDGWLDEEGKLLGSLLGVAVTITTAVSVNDPPLTEKFPRLHATPHELAFA